MGKWSRFLSLLVALLVAAGCAGAPGGGSGDGSAGGDAAESATAESGSQESGAAGGEEAAPEPVTLDIWIMPNSAESETDMLNVLKPFTDENPHIDVRVTVVDWGSAWTKITAAATSGEGPDVLQLGTTWVAAISAMGALEPLSGRVDEVGGAEAFFPASWNTTGIAGESEVYALPWLVDVRIPFYRTDVFEKAGVDPDEAFRDWESFKAALHQINGTEIDGKPVAAIGFPGKNDWNVAHNVMPWVWMAGGSALSEDLQKAAINSEAAVDGIMYYTGLAREGLVPTAVLEKNTADTEAMFTNGDFAVLFAPPYMVRQFYTPEEKGGGANSITAKNYSVGQVPAGPEGRYTFVGGSNLAIFRTSEHKEEAWELVKFLLSEEAQVHYAGLSGLLPALRSAEDGMKAVNPNFATFYEAAADGRSYPAIPAWGPVEGVLVKHFGMIWDITAGVADKPYSREAIKAQLDEAAREIDNLLLQAQ